MTPLIVTLLIMGVCPLVYVEILRAVYRMEMIHHLRTLPYVYVKLQDLLFYGETEKPIQMAAVNRREHLKAGSKMLLVARDSAFKGVGHVSTIENNVVFIQLDTIALIDARVEPRS